MFRLRGIVAAQPHFMALRPVTSIQIAGLRTTAARRALEAAKNPTPAPTQPREWKKRTFEYVETKPDSPQPSEIEEPPKRRKPMTPAAASKYMPILPVLTNVIILSKGKNAGDRVTGTFELCDDRTKKRMVAEVLAHEDGDEGVRQLFCHRRAFKVMRTMIKLASESDRELLCATVVDHALEIASDRNGGRTMEFILKHLDDAAQRQAIVGELMASPEAVMQLCVSHGGSMIARQLLEKRKDTTSFPAFCDVVSETILAHLAELLPHRNGHVVVLSALKNLPGEQRDEIVKKLLTFTNAEGYPSTPLSIFVKHEHAGRIVKYVLENGSLDEMAAMRTAVEEMGEPSPM